MAGPWEKYSAEPQTSSGKPWEAYQQQSPFSNLDTIPAHRPGQPVTAGQKVKDYLVGPTSPAKNMQDFATRVAPESVRKLLPRMAYSAYEAVKGQTDPIIESLSTLKPTGMRQKMEGSAYNTLSGLAQGMAAPTGLMGLGAAKQAWTTDPAGAALAVAPTLKMLGKAPKAPKAVMRYIGDNTQIPETLYGSAVKLPLSKRWKQTLGADEISKRGDAIAAGLANEIYPTEYGVAKAKQLKKAAIDKTESAVNELDSLGNVLPKSRLANGLADARKVATTEGSEAAQRVLDNLLEKRFNKAGELLPGNLAVDNFGNPIQLIERFYKASEMQDIKQQLYTMSNYEKTKLSRGVASQVKELGQKGMAHEAMVMLEELNPELKTMNRDTAAYISLVEGIESAAGRIQNTNPVSLGSKVLAAGNIGLAVLNQVMGVPAVKSKIAFALNKARTNPAQIKVGALREPVSPVMPTLPQQSYPGTGNINTLGLSVGDRGAAANTRPGTVNMSGLPVGDRGAAANTRTRIPLNLPTGTATQFDPTIGRNIPTQQGQSLRSLGGIIPPEPTFYDPTVGAKIPRKMKSPRDLLKDERGLVGKDINDKAIYHGTDKIFDNFDIKKSADGTVWFTDNKSAIQNGTVAASGKGKIVTRFINENDLKLGGWKEADKYSTDELINQGYDGLKLVDDGETTYQIFYPEKLKRKQ